MSIQTGQKPNPGSNRTSKARAKHYARPNDSWHCSHDNSQSCGGTGNHGCQNTRCLPQPSLRLQRGIFTTACTAIVLGLLMACLVGPNRNDFFAPGPLTDSHAQILTGQGNKRCASCHGAGDQSLSAWITDAVSSGKHIPVSQSQLCMDCHNKSLASEFALQAHNIAADDLQSITAATDRTNAALTNNDPRNEWGELACATCHQEHHGANFNLTALTDKQCQTCHVNYIHSFEKGHPEFTNWPFSERTGIAFDHVSHGVKHFQEKGVAFNCQQCHIDDAQGEVKLVASFSQTCASCHAQEISGEAAPDWTLLKLPMLDLDAIAGAGESVGSWPGDCSGDFDGQLPPAMKLLLMSDASAALILKRRGEDFEFADLDPANQQDVQDAVTLTWAIKELLFDLAWKGEAAIQIRVQQTVDVEIQENVWNDLGFGLHAAVFKQSNTKWLPQLNQEIEARRKAMKLGERFHLPQPLDDRQNNNSRLFARPTEVILQEESNNDGQLARNPLKDSNLAEGSSTPAAAPPVRQEHNDKPKITTNISPRIRSNGQGGSVVENAHTANRNQLPRGQFEGTDEWLAKNPLAELALGKTPVVPDVPMTTGSGNSNSSDLANGNHELSYEEKLANVKQAITRMPDASNRGWQRDDMSYSISYRVSGHADPLLRAWVELSNQYSDMDVIHDSGVYQSMNATISAGHCRQCHTVDTQTKGTTAVNWMPKYRDVSVRGFTRFSHRPHDMQTALTDCNSCHRLDETRSNKDSFAGSDAKVEYSNFAPISRAECASCHRKGGAPSGCVDCHNYHMGSKIFHK